MSEPKVSIVMPIYNAGDYLKEAIRDILNQTYSDFELICVDDGSTDQSPYLLNKYAEKDDRIKIITQENKGAGVARNKGMDAAQGDYIWFPDSDDRFDEKYVELMVKAIENNDADLAVCGSKGLDENTGKYTMAGAFLKIWLLPDESTFSPQSIADRLFQITAGWTWDKLFRLRFLKERNIRFQEIKSAEDAYAVYMAYALASKMTVLRDILVTHRINVKTSLEYTRAPLWRCGYNMVYEIKEGLIRESVYETFERTYINFAFEYLYWNMTTLKELRYYVEFYDYTVEEGLSRLGFFDLDRNIFQDPVMYDELRMSVGISATEFLLQHRNKLQSEIVDRDNRIMELQRIIDQDYMLSHGSCIKGR